MINQDTFKRQYWLKNELINFCKKSGLSTTGSKNDLIMRIELFLRSGIKVKPLSKKRTGKCDSHQPIMHTTLVGNYKNDVATRLFFVKHIGPNFRFNAYLRQFVNPENIPLNLTYGDLIKGWLAEERLKNMPNYKSNIDKQFEYNQFIRDFFAHEKGRSLEEAIKSWQKTKISNGPKTYAHYQYLLRNEEF